MSAAEGERLDTLNPPRRPAIYLGGPIEHAADLGVAWRDDVTDRYPEVRWINPLKKYHQPTEEQKWPVEKVVSSDLKLIDVSDGLLVRWDPVPSVGTAMEIFYATYTLAMAGHLGADARPKPVAVWMDQPEEAPIWLECFGGLLSDNVDECITWLKNRTPPVATEPLGVVDLTDEVTGE